MLWCRMYWICRFSVLQKKNNLMLLFLNFCFFCLELTSSCSLYACLCSIKFPDILQPSFPGGANNVVYCKNIRKYNSYFQIILCSLTSRFEVCSAFCTKHLGNQLKPSQILNKAYWVRNWKQLDLSLPLTSLLACCSFLSVLWIV